MIIETKVCKWCGIEKPLNEFWKNKSGRDGRHAHCRSCAYAKEVENLKKRISENPHYSSERQKAYKAIWNKRIGPGNISNHSMGNLKSKYGLTVERFIGMFEEQKERCGICGKPFTEGQRMVVDHDHKSGKVRSLVHYGCNTAIGLFLDSPELCRMAAEYLERHEVG
jgi:hypothetical protein